MLITLGRFVTPEAVVDLGVSGLRVMLANGVDGSGSTLRPYRFNQLSVPVNFSEEYRVYELSPAGRPVTEGGALVWSWIANYYWQPPKYRLTVRKADISLARISKTEYRVELEVAGVTTQYVLDRPSVRTLEEAYKVARQVL